MKFHNGNKEQQQQKYSIELNCFWLVGVVIKDDDVDDVDYDDGDDDDEDDDDFGDGVA